MKKLLIFTVVTLAFAFLFVGQVSADSEGTSNNFDAEIVISDSDIVSPEFCSDPNRIWMTVPATDNSPRYAYFETMACGGQLFRGYLTLSTFYGVPRYEGYLYHSSVPYPAPPR
ncbi:hypothetical protein [Evansella clarkii]|uniref:hypothetical protein n=1 Tax=Evansella clarkii TaxID=79879 RepID=UPI000995F51E|nr:hypothetical protein [Evansella clarkii]